MLKIVKRVEIVSCLKNAGFSLAFTRQEPMDELENKCRIIQEAGIKFKDRREYIYRNKIQQEIMRNTDFIPYYKSLLMAHLHEKEINDLLDALNSLKGQIMDYPADLVIWLVAEKMFSAEEAAAYLVFFLPLGKKNGKSDRVCKNIRYLYQYGPEGRAAVRDEKIRKLLEEICLWQYFERRNAPECLCLLKDYPAIKELVIFLQGIEIEYDFLVSDLKKLSEIDQAMIGKMEKIWESFRHQKKGFCQFFDRWLHGNNVCYELDYFSKKDHAFWKQNMKSVCDTQLGYLNEVYSGQLDIEFTELEHYQISVLTYAIAHKKKSFLKMVSDNIQLFKELGFDAIIFDAEFYHRCNLNSVTEKNLRQSAGKYSERSKLYLLRKKEYTFSELKTLRYAKEQYITLYDLLNIPRVDDRLQTIREMIKRDLVSENFTEDMLTSLAGALSRQRLGVWRERELAHIRGLGYLESVRLLMVYDQIQHLLPELQTWEEALYVVRNVEWAKELKSWSQAKKCLVEHDKEFQKLRETMGMSDDFIKDNYPFIQKFIMKEASEMSWIYYNDTNNKEAFRRIVQAELMGKFKQLKYHHSDLEKEISYPISQEQETVWKENESFTQENIEVTEADDFYTTLRIGRLPYRTCLAYDDGMHKNCILSCFDSNKKVLLAKRKGNVIGRASIRLTKGTLIQLKEKNTLEFADLMETETSQEQNKERLTLFLEKAYISNVDGLTSEKIKQLFVQFATCKAAELDAYPVLASAYGGASQNYVRGEYFMYISKSKGGEQYLDSISGNVSVSQTESYRNGVFLLFKEGSVGTEVA